MAKISEATNLSAFTTSSMLPVALPGDTTPYRASPQALLDIVNGLYLNVKNYGAVGDGVTDDTVAIQAALDAYASGKRRILFPGGTYLVSGELKPNRGCTLEGIAPGYSTIKAKAGFTFADNDTAIIHQYRDASPVVYDTPDVTERLFLRNLTIDGSDIAGSNGILCSLQQPSYWENVRVQNCKGYGVAIVDTQQAYFHNLMLIACGVGLRLRTSILCHFLSLDIEQSDDKHLVIEAQTGQGASRGNLFDFVHFEDLVEGGGGCLC